MFEIVFDVTGQPKGQPRARARNFGKHARVYSDDSADDWKSLVAIEAKRHLPAVPLIGPLRVDIEFRFPRIKKHYRTGKKSHILRDDAPYWHEVKPDRDNAEKCCLDQLTQLQMWNDDCQVCCGEVTKRYVIGEERPGAKITIRPAPER